MDKAATETKSIKACGGYSLQQDNEASSPLAVSSDPNLLCLRERLNLGFGNACPHTTDDCTFFQSSTNTWPRDRMETESSLRLRLPVSRRRRVLMETHSKKHRPSPTCEASGLENANSCRTCSSRWTKMATSRSPDAQHASVAPDVLFFHHRYLRERTLN